MDGNERQVRKQGSDRPADTLASEMENLLCDVARLLDPPTRQEMSRDEAKEQLLVTHPELRGQDLESRLDVYLAKHEEDVTRFRKARAPLSHEPASKVALADDPELHEEFGEVMDALERLYAQSLATEAGGREGHPI